MTTTAISSLIEFLLALLGDEELAADFRADPEGDARAVRPGQHVRRWTSGTRSRWSPTTSACRPRAACRTSRDGDDAVPEISVITRHYVVHHGPDINNYNYYYVDDEDIIITVDDRDTVNIHADGDLTITDSFNEDNDITVIDDSFNQDNDGIDNKGGSIDDSTVAGDDIDSSLNTDDDTTVSGSHNATETETNTDASSDTTIDGSFNDNTSDNDFIDTDVSVEGASGHVDVAPTAVQEADSLWPQEDVDATVGIDDAAHAVSG